MSGNLSADHLARLIEWLTAQAGAAVEIISTNRLSGGAIQENHRLEISVAGGDWPGHHDLVLRRDAQSAVATSHSRAEEYALLKAAHKAGVTVPAPCVLCTDESILGGPFFIMHRVAGEARGGRLIKSPPDAALVREIGADLARIHTITPTTAGSELEFLGAPPADPARAAVAQYRAYLDVLPDPHPAVEWGLSWLAEHAPAPGEIVLCHRDFRTGNYMVRDGRLTGILDWEFAGWSDPHEDIGWFCAMCWRFGQRDKPAGGIGSRAAFYRGYERVSGRKVDPKRVYFWEVFAHIRWAIIAVQQGHRFLKGGERTLDIVLTGRRPAEVEYEILRMTPPDMGLVDAVY